MSLFSRLGQFHLMKGWIMLVGTMATLVASPVTAAIDDGQWGTPLSATREAPHVQAKILTAQDGVIGNGLNRLAIELTHDKGWHTYWKIPGDAGLATRFFFTLPRNTKVSEPAFPIPHKDQSNGIVSYWLSDKTLFPFTLDVPRNDFPAGTSVTLAVKVEYLACHDICVPGVAKASITLPVKVAPQPTREAELISQAFDTLPEVASITSLTGTVDTTKGKVQLSFDVTDAKVKHNLSFFPITPDVIDDHEPAPLELREDGKVLLTMNVSPHLDLAKTHELAGLLVADDGPQTGGWAIETHIPLQRGTLLEPKQPLSNESSKSEHPASLGVFMALLLALVGGLILNLMPCVFPVLSLKLLQLVKRREASQPLAIHGWAFTGGVLLSMTLIASLLLILRAVGLSLGWGFQLQNPIVVSALLLLFIVITLNLWGTFEFTLGSHVNTRAVGRHAHGALSSFWTGVLAVVVASPCTAPFMGAALGYALTQPAWIALWVFLMLGLGMALPWLLLTLVPAMTQWLPKPGPWMDKMRRLMAIPMLGAVIWLGWVLSKQINTNGILVMIAASATLAVALWLYGREQWGKPRQRLLMTVTLLFTMGSFALVAGGFFERNAHAKDPKGEWFPWSEPAVDRALSEGHPAFVDFTAAWCLTCQVNKVSTLNRSSVQAKFQEKGVVLLMGDWTNQNPAITEQLEKYHRPGVPLYLLFQPNGEVTVFPEILTPSIIIDALDNLPDSTP